MNQISTFKTKRFLAKPPFCDGITQDALLERSRDQAAPGGCWLEAGEKTPAASSTCYDEQLLESSGRLRLNRGPYSGALCVEVDW